MGKNQWCCKECDGVHLERDHKAYDDGAKYVGQQVREKKAIFKEK